MQKKMTTPHCSWRGGLCIEVHPLPGIAIIFGAGGDLARRKLFPALFQLCRRNLVHENTRIVACLRNPGSDDDFRESLRPLSKDSACGDFLSRIVTVRGNYDDPETYRTLAHTLDTLREEMTDPSFGRIFYMATASDAYARIVENLANAGLSADSRVVLEKPFGRDSASASALDLLLHRSLDETQIYRIDHYLGKETVQNILMFRFANLLFEPVWNRNYIESVEVYAEESVGVEHRAGYFDNTGLLRDMFQNHLLEMLSLAAMEMPASFDADSVHNEKLRLLQCLRTPDPASVFRAQYTAGNSFPAYRAEPGVPPGSTTETFAAMRVFLDNWRWQDVPFFLRSGKRLREKRSGIVIRFKRIPHSIFAPVRACDLEQNRLDLFIQPDEGLALRIQAKQPGPKLCMGALTMNFRYADILESGESMPDSYERLLLDCMLGDRTLFPRSDTIALAWRFLTPVLEAWQADSPEVQELKFYPAGGNGPELPDALRP